MLGGVAKDAGATAAKELHDAIDGAIPAAGEQLKRVEELAVYGLAGVIADIANRLHGAELPLDLTVTFSATVEVSGKIGQLKLTVPNYETGVAGVEPSITVKG